MPPPVFVVNVNVSPIGGIIVVLELKLYNLITISFTGTLNDNVYVNEEIKPQGPNQTVLIDQLGGGREQPEPSYEIQFDWTQPVPVADIVIPLYDTELPNCGNSPAVVQDAQIGVDVGVGGGGVFVGVDVGVGNSGVFVGVDVGVDVGEGGSAGQPLTYDGSLL